MRAGRWIEDTTVFRECLLHDPMYEGRIDHPGELNSHRSSS